MNISQTVIYIDKMRFYAYHGVMPQEKTVGGEYTVSLEMVTERNRATETDRVEDTVNYAEAYRLVKKEMEQPSALLEHVAARIANAVLNNFAMVGEVRVDVRKDNPPMGAHCDGAGVRLCCKRQIG